MSKKLLDDILGGESTKPEELGLDLERALALSKKLRLAIKPLVEGYERKDKLVTKDEIFEALKDYPWCPGTPAGVNTALSKTAIVPYVKGRGAGRPTRWWLSEAKATLKESSRRKRRKSVK